MALRRKFKRAVWLRRIRYGLKPGLGVILAEATISSLFFSFLNHPLQIVGGGCMLAAGLITSYVKGKDLQLPPFIVDEISAENEYSISYLSSINLEFSCDETRSLFGKESIDFNELEAWRKACPAGFYQITSNAATFCGCFILISLNKSFSEQFIEGRLVESQITPDVIIHDPEFKSNGPIYICGIMVCDVGTALGRKRVAVLISAMILIIKKKLKRKKRVFYTVPITDEGISLVKNLGFVAYDGEVQRRDRHLLYKFTAGSDSLNKLYARLGDYSQILKDLT